VPISNELPSSWWSPEIGLHLLLRAHITSGHLKNGKCIFYVVTKKTLVAKVVGNAKMHISTKNGTMVPKFDVELAQTMVTWQGRPRELLPRSTSL
jgi:hypothetical protein